MGTHATATRRRLKWPHEAKAERNASLIADRISGLTFEQLAERYSISTTRCYDICAAAGVPRRRRGRPYKSREITA